MRAKLLTALAAVLLTVVALELGLRYYLGHHGDERQKVFYLYSREEIQQRASLLQGLAFLNYGLTPDRGDVNSLGYRGEEIAQPKPSGVYRIVALGGSTTYGLFLDEWWLTYPGQLQSMLRSDYGYEHVEVINAGVPQYSTWESAVNLLLRVPDLAPDMVIVYHAINDVGVRLSDPEFYDGLDTSNGYWREADYPLPPSVLLRYGLRKLGNDLDIAYSLNTVFRGPAGARSCEPDHSGPETVCRGFGMTARETLAANPPVYFERNLRNMILLARGMGARPLLLTWSYSPLDFPIEGGGGMVHAHLREGADEHNAIIRRVAEDEATLFYDLAASMPTEEAYWVNGIHMKATGTGEMARQLAAYLDSTGILAPGAGAGAD